MSTELYIPGERQCIRLPVEKSVESVEKPMRLAYISAQTCLEKEDETMDTATHKGWLQVKRVVLCCRGKQDVSEENREKRIAKNVETPRGILAV